MIKRLVVILVLTLALGCCPPSHKRILVTKMMLEVTAVKPMMVARSFIEGFKESRDSRKKETPDER